MSRFLLDTNIASYVIKGHPPEVRAHLAALPMNAVFISSVTQGELLYGLAQKGYPGSLTKLVHEFLKRVEILPWDSNAATVYGDLRASTQAAGITLGALDMMIAAHAVAFKATLVTHDKAFALVPDQTLVIVDWVL